MKLSNWDCLMSDIATFATARLANTGIQSANVLKHGPTASEPPCLAPEIRDAILGAIPRLRAFAISLTGSIDQADDLVQEAIVRGLSHIERFQPGTNMEAWLFTILRNQFYTAFRRRRREVEDPGGILAGTQAMPPEQNGYLDLEDLKVALTKLPVEQCEALLLVAAEGLSYEEAAEVCGTRIGTIKSRINRARTKLAELLAVEDPEDIGADRVIKAALRE
jgi:RNA polymerase sigma-70 factor, ECF subfamily